MTSGDVPKKPDLTLYRGGKAELRDFPSLTLPEKLGLLQEAPAKRRLSLISADPEAARLVKALPSQELFRTFVEIGAVDALELLELASPEQRQFFLDMELWEKGIFSEEKALEWLTYLLETGEETVVEQLPRLDLELLMLLLGREIEVGGGVGELLPDDERTAEWDHSFDNLYFITFKNSKNARLIGTFIDLIFRRDPALYQFLMEGVKHEIGSELEEQAFAFRNGRLADIGFPSREEAIYIYARLDPETFTPSTELRHLQPGGLEQLPAPLRGESLLARAFRVHGSADLLQELNYLINNALVVDEVSLADHEAMQTVMERVSGYLTIALEHLCGSDPLKAAGILEREPLKRLFQLGNSIVQGVKKKAGPAAALDYPTGKALNGLRMEHPLFYRGLDPDGIDGYREFAGLADVRKVEVFLENLGG